MESLVNFLARADKHCFEHLRLQVVGEEHRLLMDGECLSSSLQSLSLHAVRLPSPPIALHTLRRLLLEYQPISLRYLHEIAIACPELSTFTVREVTTFNHDSRLEARFPSLRRLSLLETHFCGIRDLLSWIEAPRLDTLVIRDSSLGATTTQTSPILGYKTYPALRHIIIRFPYAAAHIPEFLHHTPNVVMLDLSGTDVGPLAQALLAEDDHTLLPRLETITATTLCKEPHEIFKNMVLYRKCIGHAVREVCLGRSLLEEMDEEFLQSLSKHVTVTGVIEDGSVRVH